MTLRAEANRRHERLAAQVPDGFCHCGCGGRTPIATYTSLKRGIVKGQPVNYINGHGRKNRHQPVEARFWSFVNKTDGCWLWTGATRGTGYGAIKVASKDTNASRVAWLLTRGPIFDGLHVLHRCDNPLCVRPDHLFLGTPLDNMRDASAKGRLARGEANPRSKLTGPQVARLKAKLNAGEPRPHLAVEFGVSVETIHAIATGRSWRHVSAEDGHAA